MENAQSLLGAIFGPELMPFLVSLVVSVVIVLVFAFGNAYTVQILKLLSRVVATGLGKVPFISNAVEWAGFDDGIHGRGSILFAFLTAGALLNYFGVNVFGDLDWFEWIASNRELFVLLGTLVVGPVSSAIYNKNPGLFNDPASAKAK